MLTKIKLILLGILLLTLCGAIMWGLWQRNTIVKQKNEISNLSALVVAAEQEKEAIKKLTKERQLLANSNAVLKRRISAMTESRCIGEEDEEIITDITDYFNNHGVLSSGETDKAVLSTARKTDTSEASWKVKMLVENYNVIIKYALDWEKTGECYE